MLFQYIVHLIFVLGIISSRQISTVTQNIALYNSVYFGIALQLKNDN